MKIFGKLGAALTAVVILTMLPAAGEAIPDRILATGEEVPELTTRNWPQGPRVLLSELKGKKPVVLFFWTISRNGTAVFPQIAELCRNHPEAQFIGIGIDSPDSIEKFYRLKELPFPVASDSEVATMRLYLRERDRIPMVAIINADGVLVWRGKVEHAGAVLEELEAGKFDLAGSIEREKFSDTVMAAMKERDYSRVLELLDEELKKNPDNMELISLKVRLLSSVLNRPDDALSAVEDVLTRHADDAALYELAVNVCKENARWDELSRWYDRLIAAFANRPALLLKFGRLEMNQPVEKLHPANAYKLCRAAYSAPEFGSDREKGVMAAEFARALYYCGRPDKALEVASEAVELLRGTPEFESAKAYEDYYRSVLELSKSIE